MVEENHLPLSIEKQGELLSVSRSSFYYQPCQESEINLLLMKEIDQLNTQYPFCGARRIPVNLKRVSRLMRLMQIEAIYQKPNLSLANAAHKIYPYLLTNIFIEDVNQVWSTDITYIPMKQGFLYVCAVVDWYSRFILSWEISNTLTLDFCKRTLQIALANWGKPRIVNRAGGPERPRKSIYQY